MADTLAKENVDPNSKTSITSSTDAGGQKGNSARATTTTYPGPKLPAIHISTSSPYVGSSPRKHTFAKGNQASRIRNATTTFLHPRRRSSQSTPDDSQQRERTANNMQYQTDEYLDTCALPHMSAMFSNQMPLTPLTASIPGVTFQHQVMNDDRDEVEEQRELITQLAQSNAKLFGYIELLESRVRSLEAKDTYDRGPLITPPIKALGSTHSFGTVAEPELGLDATGSELDSDVHIGSASIQAPSPPVTPSKSKAKAKKAKPGFTITTPKKKANTMLNKRKTHNLTSTLPPIFTQLPAVPLTDKEIVVYFFNSLSRPIVAIRLYERGWGPARICDTLNAHRAIEPPYLRNTCSVKCITAIRRGLDKWGAEWNEQLRDLLRDADDATATDALRINDDESDEVFDIDVLQLLNGLVQHPDHQDEDGVGAGIFTECVKYCAERQVAWPLSKIHALALALQEGREPNLEEAHD